MHLFPYFMRRALRQAFEVLRADGDTSAARDILNRAIDWFESRPLDEAMDEDHREEYGLALFHAGRQDEAREVMDALVQDSEYPYLVNYRGTRASIAVAQGDTAQAIEDEEWLAGVDPPYVRGHPIFWRAVVVAALGRREEAVMLRRQAYELGMFYFWHQEVQSLLDPLRGYQPFEEFVRPKG